MDTVAEQHRTFAAQFTALLEQATDLSAPTPVAEWDVRALAEHMIWFHDFVHAGSPFGWTRRQDPAHDPLAAFVEQSSAVQNILDDAGQSDSPFFHPMASGMTLGEATARFYVADIFMHAWDLARALGVELTWPDLADAEAYAGALLVGMEQMEDVLRASGQFGPAQPVAADAPVIDRLMAFVGRDPNWQA